MKKEEWLARYKSRSGKAIARRSWEAAEWDVYDFVNLRWHSGAKFQKILDELLDRAMQNKRVTK
jgi:hypothetical protein